VTAGATAKTIATNCSSCVVCSYSIFIVINIVDLFKVAETVTTHCSYNVRTLSADVQTPLKEIFVLSLLQHSLILLVCYSDSVVDVVLAVAFAA